jgi:hypothetical protein
MHLAQRKTPGSCLPGVLLTEVSLPDFAELAKGQKRALNSCHLTQIKPRLDLFCD